MKTMVRTFRSSTGALPLVLVLAAWQLTSMLGWLPSGLLPPLLDVLRALWGLIHSGEIFSQTAISLLRAGAGLAIALVIGITMGLMMARIRRVRLMFEPVLMLVYPVPKPAIIPLFMIWLGIGEVSKIAVIALGCLLPVVTATFNGACSIDHMLLWSARARGTSPRRMLWRVVLPASLPSIATGVRTAIAVSMIVLVSAEFISSQAGLGYMISNYGGIGADDSMLAVVLWLAAIGYALDGIYLAALRHFMGWHAFKH